VQESPFLPQCVGIALSLSPALGIFSPILLQGRLSDKEALVFGQHLIERQLLVSVFKIPCRSR
jgi:hypothetical protein